MKRYMRKLISLLVIVFVIGVGLGVLHLVRRVFIADQFVIPTESMIPTLIPGDRVIVNKLLMGARLYDSLNFGKEPSTLYSRRLRGIRTVEQNDLVVFNFPWQKGTIAFTINYVYAKRCIGAAGDSVSIVNGFFRNNHYANTLGDYEQQKKLSSIPLNCLAQNVVHAYPFNKTEFGWTIKDFGPLYVPRSGDVIWLNEKNIILYRQLIEYESGEKVRRKQDKVLIGSNIQEYYEFKENYYFLCGDHVVDSRDSRYCGFVPESYIVGIISHITYSKDKGDKIRRDRVWKSVLKEKINENY